MNKSKFVSIHAEVFMFFWLKQDNCRTLVAESLPKTPCFGWEQVGRRDCCWSTQTGGKSGHAFIQLVCCKPYVSDLSNVPCIMEWLMHKNTKLWSIIWHGREHRKEVCHEKPTSKRDSVLSIWFLDSSISMRQTGKRECDETEMWNCMSSVWKISSTWCQWPSASVYIEMSSPKYASLRYTALKICCPPLMMTKN